VAALVSGANMHATQRSRRLLGLASVLLLSLLRSASAEPVVLKVGISEPVNTVLAIWMADAAGFYRAHGIKLEIINMNGGSRGAEELAKGRIDAMHVGLSSVIRLNRSGGDLRIIASLANVIRFTFFSGPGVKTAADHKGGAVGVSSFGSESDSTVTLALKRLGLSRDDVTLKEYGSSPRRLAAVKSGELKATAVNEPFSSMAREQGFNVLFDLVPEQIPWLFTAVVVRQSAIAERRDELTRFIRATAEGNYLALTDENRAKEVLAKQAGITDQKILEISYNDFKLLSPPDLEPSEQAAKNILAQFPQVSQEVDGYVDRAILDRLRQDGVFTALAQQYRR
jgi:ABC-type nitrate/sulfonate/bicarbonate transport system substrate-binding protein